MPRSGSTASLPPSSPESSTVSSRPPRRSRPRPRRPRRSAAAPRVWSRGRVIRASSRGPTSTRSCSLDAFGQLVAEVHAEGGPLRPALVEALRGNTLRLPEGGRRDVRGIVSTGDELAAVVAYEVPGPRVPLGVAIAVRRIDVDYLGASRTVRSSRSGSGPTPRDLVWYGTLPALRHGRERSRRLGRGERLPRQRRRQLRRGRVDPRPAGHLRRGEAGDHAAAPPDPGRDAGERWARPPLVRATHPVPHDPPDAPGGTLPTPTDHRCPSTGTTS